MTRTELQITDAELIAALRAELAAAHRRADVAEQRAMQADRPCPSAKVCAGLQCEVERLTAHLDAYDADRAAQVA